MLSTARKKHVQIIIALLIIAVAYTQVLAENQRAGRQQNRSQNVRQSEKSASSRASRPASAPRQTQRSASRSEQRSAPRAAPRTSAKSAPAQRSQPRPAPKAAQRSQPRPQPRPALKPQPKAQPKPAPRPAPKPQPKVQPKPAPGPQPTAPAKTQNQNRAATRTSKRSGPTVETVHRNKNVSAVASNRKVSATVITPGRGSIDKRANDRVAKVITPIRSNGTESITKVQTPLHSRGTESVRKVVTPLQNRGTKSIRDTKIVTRPHNTIQERNRHRVMAARQDRTALRSRIPVVKRDEISKVVITGNNNIYISGDVKKSCYRPYIPHRRFRTMFNFHSNPHWFNWYGHFTYTWSPYSCGRIISLNIGPYYGLSYFYPSYHRKYIFVSIGNYWPYRYRYRRYYWYGCHPHYWYGSNVITQPVENNTYNTYNYYYNTDTTPAYNTYNTNADYNYDAAYEDFSDVREKLKQNQEQPQDEPELATPADYSFEKGIKAFGEADYAQAVDEFRRAVLLEPEDIIMPFTYSQALFADGDYAHAASVLRSVLDLLPEGQETIYYPRGLYEDEKVLNEQIEQLAQAAQIEPFNSDHNLLLGYQLLGIGQLDQAGQPLTMAQADPTNAQAATMLLNLLEEVKKQNAEDTEI